MHALGRKIRRSRRRRSLPPSRVSGVTATCASTRIGIHCATIPASRRSSLLLHRNNRRGFGLTLAGAARHEATTPCLLVFSLPFHSPCSFFSGDPCLRPNLPRPRERRKQRRIIRS